jgi:hypothetical protein
MQHAWGRRGMRRGFSWESQKNTDHKGDIEIGGRILLK